MDEKMNSLAIVAIVGIVVFGVIVASGFMPTGYATMQGKPLLDGCNKFVASEHAMCVQRCTNNDLLVEGPQQECIANCNTDLQINMDSCQNLNGGTGACKKYESCNSCQAVAGCAWSGTECYNCGSEICMIQMCDIAQILY